MSVPSRQADCASNHSAEHQPAGTTLQPAELHPRNGLASVAVYELLDDAIAAEQAGARATVELDVWALMGDLAALEEAGLVRLRRDGRVEAAALQEAAGGC